MRPREGGRAGRPRANPADRPFACRRWVRVTVLRGCVGCRTVAVRATATGRDLKERIFAETGFPVAEQRLWRGDREVGQRQACPLRWAQSPAGGRKFTGSCLSRKTDAQMIQ